MVLLIRSMAKKFLFLITQLCEPQILQGYGCFNCVSTSNCAVTVIASSMAYGSSNIAVDKKNP